MATKKRVGMKRRPIKTINHSNGRGNNGRKARVARGKRR